MIAGKLIFIALTLTAYAAGLTSRFSIPVMIILVFAWQRVMVQKNKILIMSTLVVILLFNMRFTTIETAKTLLTIDGSDWVNLAVKQTSWKVDGDKLEFEGLLQKGDLSEKVKVTYYIKDESEKHRLDDSIPINVAAKGTLSEPGEPTNFNQFNYRTYLKSKAIIQVMKVSELVIPEAGGKKGSQPYTLDRMRQSILTHIDKTMTQKTGAYTKTLLFADKRSFSSEVMDSFKELGIIHLLSISGLHVIFIISLLRHTLLRLRVSRETAAMSLLLILPLYGITTGFGISVFRAVGQSWLNLFAEKYGIKITALDSWSVMLLAALFIQPYSLYMIGFQLSFLISFIIIVLSDQDYFKRWSRLQMYMGMNLLLLLASVPILSYHFYEFSWGVLVLNSLFIPFVAHVLLPLLIVCLMLSVLMTHSVFFQSVLLMVDKMISFVEASVSSASSTVSFTIVTGRLSQAVYFLLALSIILLFVLLEKGKPKRFWVIPAAGIMLSLFSVRLSPAGQVLMIDVGQGEAILIKEPWGRGNYLIDTGGQVVFPVEEWQKRDKIFTVGENILLPVLKSEGIHKLESVIITHPDIDHYGALLDILSEIPTEKVVSAKATFLQENFQVLFPSIESYGTIIKEAVEGSSMDLPSNMYAVLSSRGDESLSKNDRSLVLYGSIGRKTWLFTGDLEADGEKIVMEKYPGMTVDVLKVGHHGSQTSSQETFIDQLRPDTAWISAGQANRFGHPHTSVIEKLAVRDITTYRTDTQGAVRYRFTDQLPIMNLYSNLFSFEQKRELRGE